MALAVEECPFHLLLLFISHFWRNLFKVPQWSSKFYSLIRQNLFNLFNIGFLLLLGIALLPVLWLARPPHLSMYPLLQTDSNQMYMYSAVHFLLNFALFCFTFFLLLFGFIAVFECVVNKKNMFYSVYCVQCVIFALYNIRLVSVNFLFNKPFQIKVKNIVIRDVIATSTIINYAVAT